MPNSKEAHTIVVGLKKGGVMIKEKIDAILEERNLYVTTLNRELLHFSEFSKGDKWSEEEEKKAKKALLVATQKVNRTSCTTSQEEQFYIDVIEKLSERVKLD